MTTPLQAAFIALGMQHPDDMGIDTFNAALDKWDRGMLELITAGTHYAEYSLKLMEAGYSATNEYPGVAEYEISEEFGSWFTQKVVASPDGDTPEHSSCCYKLLNLAVGFFGDENRGLSPEMKIGLHKALTAVTWPEAP